MFLDKWIQWNLNHSQPFAWIAWPWTVLIYKKLQPLLGLESLFVYLKMQFFKNLLGTCFMLFAVKCGAVMVLSRFHLAPSASNTLTYLSCRLTGLYICWTAEFIKIKMSFWWFNKVKFGKLKICETGHPVLVNFIGVSLHLIWFIWYRLIGVSACPFQFKWIMAINPTNNGQIGFNNSEQSTIVEISFPFHHFGFLPFWHWICWNLSPEFVSACPRQPRLAQALLY